MSPDREAGVPEDLQTVPARPRNDDSERRIRKVARTVYVLQAVAIFFGGIPFIVGIVINYVKMPQVRETWLESHFRWQIRTFWFALLWLMFGVVVIPALLPILVWVIYRIVRGWLRLSDGVEMYSESRPS